MLLDVPQLNVMNKILQQKGFTLIEVVIATFIVGIALIAVVGTIQSITAQTSRVQEIFIGNLIAKNAMTELQLSPVWAELGEKSESVEMANTNWFKDIIVIETEVETLRRVEITVGIDDDERKQSCFLVGFISQTSQLGQRPVQWLEQGFNSRENAPEDRDNPENPETPIPVN